MENGGGVSGAEYAPGEGSDQRETSPVGEAVNQTVSTCVHDRGGILLPLTIVSGNRVGFACLSIEFHIINPLRFRCFNAPSTHSLAS